MYKITLMPGDGIGPEVTLAAKRCIEATGLDIQWEEINAGASVLEKEGTPLPQKVIDSIKRNKVALKGPIITPVGKGFRSVNVAIRQKLNLFACLRPCKSYEGTHSKYKDVDIIIVRENTEDLYAGIEFEQGKKQTKELIEKIEKLKNRKIKKDSGISIKPNSVSATKDIVRFAFEYALKNRRSKVTAVHKANILKYSDGLFLEVARQIAKDYEDKIEFTDRIVDNMCMQLVLKPEDYDVLVLPNLYGDIISDLCSGLTGGLGLSPGANIGNDIAVFEATHGAAPKYQGQNKVNPTAMILSAVLMLKYLGEDKKALQLESAVAEVIKEGKSVTYDLKEDRNDPSAVGTSEMADAIIKKIKE
jgi:isocitrate dehydrogenase (NAD+)